MRFAATDKSKHAALVGATALIIWLAVVIFTAAHHEFWRDEVRAFSLARQASSPLDLVRLLRDEGHPVLWYLLLYIANSIAHTPTILPVASITVAFAGVAVFIFRAPFPIWFRSLFLFGALPLYEYSVEARNYGISMALLFIAAAIYSNRSKHPITLAAVLALLANTNVHSTMFVALIATIWAWEWWQAKTIGNAEASTRSIALALTLILAGLLLCVVVARPHPDSVVTASHHFQMRDVANSLGNAVFLPGRKFYAPFGFPLWLTTLVLWFSLLGLLPRLHLFLAALSAQSVLAIFFDIVYPGELRQQGLLFCFLIFLYWLLLERVQAHQWTKAKRVCLNTGLCAMSILLLGSVRIATQLVRRDIQKEASSSKALGAFLNSSALYHDAILLPEPDYFIESLPYYAGNRIYFAREHRFGTTVSFTTASDEVCSLGELLGRARELNREYKKPVLIVLAHPEINRRELHEKHFSFNKIFTSSDGELADFNRATHPVEQFNSAYRDENYDVYALR